MRKRLVTVALAAALALVGLQGVAAADPSNGNSGHVGGSAHECQNGNSVNCPPFGTDK